jgi:hypothetical protein
MMKFFALIFHREDAMPLRLEGISLYEFNNPILQINRAKKLIDKENSSYEIFCFSFSPPGRKAAKEIGRNAVNVIQA